MEETGAAEEPMGSQVYLLTLKPCNIWTSLWKNMCIICIGSYGTLEVAGVTVLVIILSLEQLLEILENVSVFIMCFSLEL